ncbi:MULTISPECIES: Na+/H+ antiporter subunit A [Oceanobacillus]|uniref:Na(+)/H(+) antiporter subunit A n=1 Tax=Oceanobacillus kimchii TaxID=746691 RepID=A0ABQ5TPR1_9BACI|nr:MULTISPECIES: Na+/H+ antiporter subunit A [Oceanobacillus]MBT2599574.1 Na+/H+ antiporter subunit A [Oceanobacillus sp. ISL-74]GLO67799.1 Na(+)/H(+) antiporter subunit A [Oceanobacillus kimchii]
MTTLIIAIMFPFIAAAIIPFLYKYVRRIHVGWFALFVSTALFIYFAQFIPTIASGDVITFTLNWIPSYGINITSYLDGLSLTFSLLISGIGALVILYSIYYLSSKESLGHFYTYLMLFMGAMLGVVTSDNMLVLYVFWELTSISSFLLIAFWYQRKRSRDGAKKSLLITVTGGIAMLVGFIMLGQMAGTWSIREVIGNVSSFNDHYLFIAAMILVLLGAFTKSAQFPFHIWLPDAMEAPTPVSAYLHSATMVKAGIYLVARFTPVFGGEATWFWAVTGVGLFTLFWGSFNAVRQIDLKALLAYSTISQLGMIMSMFGIGSAALNLGYSTESVAFTSASFAALFHLVNHSTFKGALFMVVGIVDHSVGTRDIRRLGGLITLMPVTFSIALIGSLSMAGLPPFNGFLSKEMFFMAVVNISEAGFFALETWGILLPIVAWVASVFTFVYSAIIVVKTFLGPYQEEKLEHPAHEPKPGMLVSPIILALLVIGVFFFPNIIGKNLITPAMSGIFPTLAAEGVELGESIYAWHGFELELFMTIGVVLLGLALFYTRKYWTGVYRLFPEKWSINVFYGFILDQIEEKSTGFTNSYMTQNLRDYLVYIYLFFIISIGGMLLYTGAYQFELPTNAAISNFELITALVMMSAAIAILFAKSRLTAILLNSILGFGVAIFFVLFRAPDLALTQTIVESVTTVLFLAAYYFLPEWKKEDAPKKTRNTNLVISICVGVVFTVVALMVQSGKTFESISKFFENSYELAGGKNMVNSILGDFRALDTMLEVVVLLIAGIGVYVFIKLKNNNKEGEQYEDK